MSANSKLVEKWIQKTQPECKFIKWVREGNCTIKPICNNPNNVTGKCVYAQCPKVTKNK